MFDLCVSTVDRISRKMRHRNPCCTVLRVSGRRSEPDHNALALRVLAYYVGTDVEISEVLHVTGEKGSILASAGYVIQEIFRFLAH